MIKLFDKDTHQELGKITEEHLQFLLDQLVEESSSDRDYYINLATLEMFEEDGADPALVAVLRQALGEREEMEIEWRRD